MKKLEEYGYDVFLSWTGKDEKLKDQIKQALIDAGIKKDAIFDSDDVCKGDILNCCMDAINRSKVFLLLLTDKLFSYDIDKNSRISICREEVSMAVECENFGNLNMEIFCLSKVMTPDKQYDDYADGSLAQFYYNRTRGRSFIYAETCREPTPEEESTDGFIPAIQVLVKHVLDYISARNAGEPRVYHTQDVGIIENYIPHRGAPNLKEEREDELLKIDRLFTNGKKIVVLEGERGVGKSRCAAAYANYVSRRNGFGVTRVQMSDAVWEEFFEEIPLTSETEIELRRCLSGLPDKNKRNKRRAFVLDLLSRLPESRLIWIDGINMYTEGFHDALMEAKFKGRIIVTSDGHFGGLRSEDIEIMRIEPFSLTVAHRMFDKKLGNSTSESAFEKVYTLFSGNTLALGLWASVVRENPNTLSIQTILEDLAGANAEITYASGNSEFCDTLINHLARMFGLANLEEEEKDLLRNLCLLRKEAIPIRDVIDMMGYKNENVINRLNRKGILTKTKDDIELHTLYKMVFVALGELQLGNTQKAVEHVLRITDAFNGDKTYDEIVVMADDVWYALEQIAKSDGEFCGRLFDRYFKIVEYRDYGRNEMRDRCKRLAQLTSRCSQKTEEDMLSSVVDGIDAYEFSRFSEGFSAALERVERHASVAAMPGDHYKWVAKILQRLLVLPLSRLPEYSERLNEVIVLALKAAVERNDDLAVLAMVTICWGYDRMSSKVRRIVSAYLRRRKKEIGQTGVNIFTWCIQILSRRSPHKQFENYREFVADVMGETNHSYIGILMRHSRLIYGGVIAQHRLKKVDEEDPFKRYLEMVKDSVTILMDGETLDVRKIVESALLIFKKFEEADLTSVKKQEFVRNFVVNLKKVFPPEYLGEFAAYIESDVCGCGSYGLSIESFRRLIAEGEIACEMQLRFGSLENLAEAVERHAALISAGHPDVLRAWKVMANLFGLNGDYRQQYYYLEKIFHSLYSFNCDHLFVDEVCYALIVNKATYSGWCEGKAEFVSKIFAMEESWATNEDKVQFFAQAVFEIYVSRRYWKWNLSGVENKLLECLRLLESAFTGEQSHKLQGISGLLWALGHVAAAPEKFEPIHKMLSSLRKKYRRRRGVRRIANAMRLHAKLMEQDSLLKQKYSIWLAQNAPSMLKPIRERGAISIDNEILSDAMSLVRGLCRYLQLLVRDRMTFPGRSEIQCTVSRICVTWRNLIDKYDTLHRRTQLDEAAITFADALFKWSGGDKYLTTLTKLYGDARVMSVKPDEEVDKFFKEDAKTVSRALRSGDAGQLLYEIYNFALKPVDPQIA